MRDTYRRYRAIAQCLLQLYPQVGGHQRRHLATLALLICGIVGSQHTQLPQVVEQTPGGRAADERVVMRFRRRLKRDNVTSKRWMLPVAQARIAMSGRRPLLFVIDGSTVGRGCMCLMISVLYQRRALPITWLVVKARKGHLPEALHCALLEHRAQLVPAEASVTILGDGAYDGADWQAAMTARGWKYVRRTARNILLTLAEATIALGDRAPKRGEVIAVEQVSITAAQDGPVHVLAVWEAADEHPSHLVTTHADVEDALALDRRRAQIETCFSDQKSRGFRINRSHISDPTRRARLLIATALAYLWVVHLGVAARRDALRGRIHRPDRCDLSLFSLGLRLLAYCLRHRRTIPRGLPKPLFTACQTAFICSVR